MVWTKQLIWKTEHPNIFSEIFNTKPEDINAKYGRVYWHGSLDNSQTDLNYSEELRKEIPYHGNSSYADVLKEDLKLHKMAISKKDQCFQLIDRTII